MASAIALTFSKVVDPNNPLYLDDNCCENVEWDFGVLSPKEITAPSKDVEHISKLKPSLPENKKHAGERRAKAIRHDTSENRAKIIEIKSLDSCEMSGPAVNAHFEEEECDEEIMNTDASSVSSLEPYDLSDDDTDLQKNFTQLTDLAAALRKPDDPDGVENALSSADKLVRASPDELRHNSGDLVIALVHVRCSDVAMEGEEDSAEEKRQKALVALLVTCTFECSHQVAVLIKRGCPWREVSDSGTLLNWSHRYEREVPSRSGQVTDTGMLGVCMKCIAMHPEASAVAPALLDMIRSRGRDPWGPPAIGWGHSSSVGSAARDDPTEEMRLVQSWKGRLTSTETSWWSPFASLPSEHVDVDGSWRDQCVRDKLDAMNSFCKASSAMGNSLPVESKVTVEEENDRIKYVVSSMQGLGDKMEDAHAAILSLDDTTSTSFFGVYDGHGGAEVASYCAKQFHIELCNHEDYHNDLTNALNNVFFSMDENLQQSDAWRELVIPRDNGWMYFLKAGICANFWPFVQAAYTGPAYEGSTACVVVIRGDQMIVGHAGDSRCVLSRQGSLAIDLSSDHKPRTSESERERVQNAGGISLGIGCEKVMGNYVIKEQWALGDFGGSVTISRSIGDFAFKKNKDLDREEQMLICDPDILTDYITDDMEFLVIASQGLWSCMESADVVAYIHDRLSEGAELRDICEEVVQFGLPSGENTTVILRQSGELVPTPSANNTVTDEVDPTGTVAADDKVDPNSSANADADDGAPKPSVGAVIESDEVALDATATGHQVAVRQQEEFDPRKCWICGKGYQKILLEPSSARARNPLLAHAKTCESEDKKAKKITKYMMKANVTNQYH
uniref:protein-serine/threonine phosphatase n=1 Tax=Oryza nivara TaxID=4536 RepID=A0A0E0GIN3_ORYNI